ncbi:hypothetical protein D3C87_1975550 [compost metagenome]
MAGIAGEMAQRIERTFKPHHEGIDRIDQALHLVGNPLGDRMQIIGTALRQRLAETIERTKRQRDGHPDDRGRTQDHEEDTQRGP